MRRLIVALALAELCSCAAYAPAQNAVAPVENRVFGPIDEAERVTLKGNVHPLAQKQFDQGSAPGSTPTGRSMLVLQRSAAQQRALTQFLSDLQNPVSPAYHRWLTPAQYAAAFAVSESDLLRVQSWLQAHGFKIEKVFAAHNVIEFSGNFDQVQTAFHTSIDKFSVNGETHFANVSDPQIPAALAPVIAGVGPLNDFHPKPMLVRGPNGRYDPSTGRVIPELTITGNNTSYLFVDPADAAIIYDTPNSLLNPAYSGTTYDGTGVSIGIVGISDLTLADVANYRMAFLGEASGSVNLPTVIVDGNDPGLNGKGGEALLDTEVSGGIAPKAKIYFYTSDATDLSSGLLNAMFRALDDNTVSILNLSFHECEAALGTSGNQIVLESGEQAAAQGITRTNSAGDLGPADCESGTESQATQGFAVNGLASSPYTIAVGGTDFDALPASFASYVDNTSRGIPPYYATALKYIPENPWNDSTTVNTTLSNNVAYKNSEGVGNTKAGSGGVSSVYAKPAFQTSLTPNDGFRDLPDVSLLSGGMYHAAWAFCTDNVTDGVTTETYTDCQTTNGQFTSNTVVAGAGGTSASAPAFAGMLALVAQAHGSPSDNYRLGQANNILYQLAQSTYSTVFHDITTGNNSVACASGSPDCGSNLFLTGYNAGNGYDLASGLGSVDAAEMVNNWTSVSLASTSTNLAINGSTAAYTGVHGQAVTFDVGVSPATATGVAAIVDNADEVNGGVQNNGQFAIPISSGAGSAAYGGLPGGSYTVWARYGGDTANASSTSTPPIQVTITPESSTTTVAINAYDSVTEKPIPATNIPYGSYVFADAQITGTAEGSKTQGVATGKVIFADGANTLDSAAVNSGNKASWPILPASLSWPTLALTIPVLSGGSHQIAASYSGDPSYDSSSSQPLAVSIVPAATSFVIDEPSYLISSVQMATVVFELNTNWNPGLGPTGTVSLTENNQVLGSTDNFLLSKGNLSENVTGSIPIQGSQFPAGLNTVTLAYSGDSNYAPATATITVDNTGQPAFTLSNSGTLQVNAGATSGNTTVVSLTPTNGFTGTVNLSCVVNTSITNPTDLPACALSPAAVNISGTTKVTSTLIMSTTAPTGVALGSGPFRIGGLTALLALLFWFEIPWRRSVRLRTVIAMALAASIGVLGCGSGGGSAKTGGGNAGTTPGSYSVTVTATDAATGKITAQTTVNVTVNG